MPSILLSMGGEWHHREKAGRDTTPAKIYYMIDYQTYKNRPYCSP